MNKGSKFVGHTAPLAFILVLLILLFSFIEPANAYSRYQNRDIYEVHDQPIEVFGEVICKLAPVNNGQPCPIQIKDTQTGQVYQLTNAGSVRREHSKGQHRVKIEGYLRTPTSIEVQKVQ